MFAAIINSCSLVLRLQANISSIPSGSATCPSTITAFCFGSTQIGYSFDNRFAPLGAGNFGGSGAFLPGGVSVAGPVVAGTAGDSSSAFDRLAATNKFAMENAVITAIAARFKTMLDRIYTSFYMSDP